MTARGASANRRWAALAAALDVDEIETRICYACLSFVVFPLADGDTSHALREARQIAPDLWHEGMEAPLLASLRAAVDDGVPDAEGALRDVEARRARSPVVAAVVLRIAEDEARRMRTGEEVIAASRFRLPLAPPGSN